MNSLRLISPIARENDAAARFDYLDAVTPPGPT
jgi:hypothetical protein